jgi:ABC-2 type transport system permease protein
MLASTQKRLINISRYKGQLVTDLIIPIVLAAMPIFLGQATGGAGAAAQFEANTGTSNYIGYMMLGSSVFTIVSYALWHVAYWLRYEMETGTIEAIYLAPANTGWMVAGVGLYSMIRSILGGFLSYVIGSFLFGANPFQGDMLIALGFVLVGIIPLYGITLLFGALVLKLKRADAVINLMQWAMNFLMGVLFPLTVLPPVMRFVSLMFPPTWMTNGVRSAMLGVGYFFGEWYFDLAILWVFMIISPMVGLWVFKSIETGVRRNEGVGKF